MNVTAKELAGWYAERARTNYMRDGRVHNVALVLDRLGAGVMMTPNPQRFGGQAREQLAALVLSVGAMIDATFVGTITEAWTSSQPSKGEIPDIPRGHLQKQAETDPEVRTCVVVQVFDVKHRDRSHSVMSTVRGDPLEPQWDTHDYEGVMMGGLPEAVLHAYEVALTNPPLPGNTLAERLQVLVETEMITSAVVTEAHDPQPERNQN